MAVQVYVLSVPNVGNHSSKLPDSDHYFVRDLVLRLQIGQTNADGSPLNRCFPTDTKVASAVLSNNAARMVLVWHDCSRADTAWHVSAACCAVPRPQS